MGILSALISDKKAMAPPGMGKAAGGAAKSGTKAAGTKPSGGGGNTGGEKKGGAMDAASSMSERAADSQRIKQHEQKLKELEEKKKQVEENQLRPLQDRSKQIDDEMKATQQQIDQAKQTGQNTMELRAHLQDLKNTQEQTLAQIRALITQLAEIRAQISSENGFISQIKADESTDLKADSLTAVPYTRPVGEAMQMAEGMKHDNMEKKLAGSEQKLQQDLSSGGTSGGAGAAGGPGKAGGVGASGKPGKPGAPGKPGSSGGAGSSGGIGAGGSIGKAGMAGSLLGGAASAGGQKWHDKHVFGWIKNTWKGGALGKIFIIILMTGFGGFMLAGSTMLGVDSPLGTLLAKGGYGITGGGAQVGAEKAAMGGQNWLSQAVSNFQSSYRKSMAQATGQRVDGKVEQAGCVGIEIKEPYIRNPTKVNQDEPFEISARVRGFHPKKDMRVGMACHLQLKSLSYNSLKNDITGKGKVGGNVEYYAGDKMKLNPEVIEGNNFDQEVTCFPKVHTCGQHEVTITTQANGIQTDSVLNNYIIDKTYLYDELKEYAKSKNRELSSQGQIESAMRELHPEVEDYTSISEKGPAAVFMITEKAYLIGIDAKKQLKFRVAVENQNQGWLREINSVKVIIPKGLQPVAGFCDYWDVSGDSMTLSKSLLDKKKSSLKAIKKGNQMALPVCYFQYAGPQDEIIGSAKRITFLASVDYNYLIQKQYKIDVRTETGAACKKSKAKIVSSGSIPTSSGTGVKASSTEAEVKAMNEKAKAKFGEPGPAAMESTTILERSVTVNKGIKSSVKAVEANIKQYCPDGVKYFKKGANMVGYANIPHPKYTKYKSPSAYGIVISLNKATNPDGQTTKTLKSDLPKCVISAFKTNGFIWGGDVGPPYNPSMFQFNF